MNDSDDSNDNDLKEDICYSGAADDLAPTSISEVRTAKLDRAKR